MSTYSSTGLQSYTAEGTVGLLCRRGSVALRRGRKIVGRTGGGNGGSDLVGVVISPRLGPGTYGDRKKGKELREERGGEESRGEGLGR